MMFYQLDAEKLRSGDVLLEAGSGLISEAIKIADRGAFSHAFLYVGMSMIMEADEGVRMLMASRVITDSPDKFLVLRHPDYEQMINNPEWGKFTNSLMFWLLQPEANKDYNWRGMFGTKLPFLNGTKGTFFCSQLVAEGYRRARIHLFRAEIPPERVTPNMFDSANCLLKPVAGCFTALPDRSWIAEFGQNRYDVMKEEPVPLAHITHERAKEIVAAFGPRVDELTRRINKKQHIASVQDLYLTLTFPDLPEADQISDELVEFMERRFPAAERLNFIELCKRSFEYGISLKDAEVNALITRTLRRDISATERLVAVIAGQAQMMKAFPPPPLKRRSIHKWLEKKLADAVASEKELLQWRKNALARIPG
ncbi:MAG TPA: hypothetical protein VH678_32030 [Xanthobacteraceae bacterium]|jgi:hypothetical protein